MSHVEQKIFDKAEVTRQFHTDLDFWAEKCYQNQKTWRDSQELETVPRDELGMTDYRKFLMTYPKLRDNGVWDRVNANLPLDFDASRWRPTDTEDLKLARGAWAGLGDWKPQPLSRKEKMAQKKKKRD